MEFKSLSEKTAYLRGLIKGLKTDDEVVTLMAEILSDMAHLLEQTRSDVGELAELVDNIDEDLGEIEGDFYETADDMPVSMGDFDELDDDIDDDGTVPEEEMEEELYEEEERYEVTCPTCGDTISLNAAMIEEGTITCPCCGELLEFDLDEEDEEADPSDSAE